MKLIRESILNKIQLAGEVSSALTEYDLVVVTKTQVEGANPVFTLYACHGKLAAGQIQETPAEGQ